MLRADCAILDGDDSEVAWGKLSARLEPLLSYGAQRPHEAPLARRLAPLARLLGIEVAGPSGPAEREDAQSAREGFFGAVRGWLEALAREVPLVLVWEDIHWADEGMLDLIDYLSQWLRAPVLQVCLARDELLERRSSWSASRRTATSLFLDPLAPEDTRALIAGRLGGAAATPEVLDALATRAEGNPLFAEEMVQRLAEEGGARAAELPDTVHGLLAARLDSLAPLERQLVLHAAVVGRTFWEGALAPVAAEEGGDLQAALATLRDKDIIVPSDGAQLADEQQLAFKHVLIRDVAYAMLPKAVRARKHFDVGELHRAARRRAPRGGGGAARRALRARGRARRRGAAGRRTSSSRCTAKALEFLEAAGDAAGALYSNQEAFAHYEAALALVAADDAARARIEEKQGDIALRLGRVDAAIEVWERWLAYHSELGELEHVAELHRKIGAALAHKGERTQAIQHHQQGINLIKDGPRRSRSCGCTRRPRGCTCRSATTCLRSTPPRRRSGSPSVSARRVRRAARTGSSGACSAASATRSRRARTSSARSSWRGTPMRTRPCSRCSRWATTSRTPRATTPPPGGRYADALALAERVGDVPAQIELHAAIAQLAFYRCDWEQLGRSSDASAELAEREGLVGKLCLAHMLPGWLRWREGDWEDAAQLFERARENAEQVGWSEVAFNSLLGLAVTQRDRGDFAGATASIAHALEVCDRAGLIGQSIQATSLRVRLARALGRARARPGDRRANRLTGRAGALSARRSRSARGARGDR